MISGIRDGCSDARPWGTQADELAHRLPTDHLDFLRQLNGFTFQQGAVKVFGVGRSDHLDLVWWNDAATWRFAWDDRVDGFLCFASTGFGDQFAYRVDADGGIDGEVHFLEAVLMRSRPAFACFEDFVHGEIIRIVDQPYDPNTVAALHRLGPLPADSIWAYCPSIAIGGPEDPRNIVVLPAHDAMTLAGDIASAWNGAGEADEIRAVHPWIDESGRQRLRVDFG